MVSEEGAKAVAVLVTDNELVVTLKDGRRVSTPLSRFPRLAKATPKQHGNWELIAEGDGIHWPDIDEDLSVAGLLRGTLAPGGHH